MPMADYDFYVNTYLGSAVPEQMFPALLVQANAALEKIERSYQVSGGEDSRKMALCAMVETLYAYSKRRSGVVSSRVGSVSVSYESGKQTHKALWQELYQQACVYLDIYRGVSL